MLESLAWVRYRFQITFIKHCVHGINTGHYVKQMNGNLPSLSYTQKQTV